MKKALSRIGSNYYYYDSSGGLIQNQKPAGISGDLTGISGNLTGISGNLTYISGNLTGIGGDLDECEISDEERDAGIEIENLIK